MKKLNGILLIDDDEVTNFINAEILQELELAEKVEFCLNGKEALDKLRLLAQEDRSCANFPDLIFLDINMPVMDGFEFLKNYQEEFSDRAGSVAITFLTTSLRHEDLERARTFEAIVNGYIEKPLTKAVVQRFMDEAYAKLGK